VPADDAGDGLGAVGGTGEIEVLAVDETLANSIHLELLDLQDKSSDIEYRRAELLYTVDVNRLYRKILTGYQSFEEYAESIGVGSRKARYLVAIWDWFMVRHDDPLMASGVRQLSWPKAKELVEIVTPENQVDWFERAKRSTVRELTAAKRAAKKAAKQSPKSSSGKGKAKAKPKPPSRRQGKKVDVPPPVAAGAPLPTDEQIEAQLAENGDWMNLTFRVNKEWMETIRLALSEAKELGGGRIAHDGYALEMICLSFVSEMSSDVDRDRRAEWLAWAERVTGVTIIGVDELNGKIVYGDDSAARLSGGGKPIATSDTDDALPEAE